MTMRELIIARSAARVVAGYCRLAVDGVLPRRGAHAAVIAESEVGPRRITITVPRELLPTLFGNLVPGVDNAERELLSSLTELARRTSSMLAHMIERDAAAFAREPVPDGGEEVILRVHNSWVAVHLREVTN